MNQKLLAAAFAAIVSCNAFADSTHDTTTTGGVTNITNSVTGGAGGLGGAGGAGGAGGLGGAGGTGGTGVGGAGGTGGNSNSAATGGNSNSSATGGTSNSSSTQGQGQSQNANATQGQGQSQDASNKQGQGQSQDANNKQGQGQAQDASNNGVQNSVNINHQAVASSAGAFLAQVASNCGGSAGGSGQGMSFGGVLGFTFEFSDCKVLRRAAFLLNMGKPNSAMQVLCDDKRIKEAFALTGDYACLTTASGNKAKIGTTPAPSTTGEGYKPGRG